MNALDTGSPATRENPGKPRLGMVCLNLHPSAEGAAVLLSHQETRILFHEFGHLLHLMFTRVSIPSLAGTSVPRDFVEVPSQFMENWCWHPDVLKSFARHEKTGLPIPEEMLRSLDASRGNHSQPSPWPAAPVRKNGPGPCTRTRNGFAAGPWTRWTPP